MSQSRLDAMNNFINGEISKKPQDPLCTLSTMELEKDTTVCASGLVKHAITRLNASTEMLADEIKQADYEPVPTTKPPGVVRREIRDKGKLLLQLLWILLQIIPAILYAIYVKLLPPKGKSLRGKVALVTGAGRGLGRGLALALSREGCKLACADIDMVGCEETVRMIAEERGTAKAYRANVAKPQEIDDMRKKIEAELGPVVFVINNASLIVSHRIDDENHDADRAIAGVINVNLLSHFYMIRAFLPSMRKNQDGHIVAIASMSSFTGLAYSSVYASCKWAVRGIMESLREELKQEGEKNVQLTCVHPYFINTSAQYTSNWNIRFPELTIDEVVEATIHGIKQNHFSVSIPEDMYYNIHVMKWPLENHVSTLPDRDKEKENSSSLKKEMEMRIKKATVENGSHVVQKHAPVKLLPRFIQNQLLDVFYAKISVLSSEEVEKSAAKHIINKSMQNSNP